MRSIASNNQINLNPTTEGNQQAGGNPDFVMGSVFNVVRLEANLEAFNKLLAVALFNGEDLSSGELNKILDYKSRVAVLALQYVEMPEHQDLFARVMERDLSILEDLGCQGAVRLFKEHGYWT